MAVATDTPDKIDLETVKEYFPGRKVILTYTLPEYIESALSVYQKPLETRFSTIISSGQRVAPEIVEEIIKDAVAFEASDIHFEPGMSEVVVRFRTDGDLREAGRLPREYYENILNRIKVESGMRIDEHLSAQDGAITRRAGGLNIDLRVSLVPTISGEKVVMRVLGSYVQSFTLVDMGFSEKHRLVIEAAAKKPFGMILAVGPTGSGKTTTLYSIVKLLNRPDVNITTIEDPVEYKIPGITQIQVREASQMTFTRGLRAIVRQDPDIVLVGEIRDRETAEISVNAALTGHLLLSTFHANDAATALPRLVDLGIEPFLLASTIEIVIAQRLVRKVCGHCKHSVPLAEALGSFESPGTASITARFTGTESLFEGKGCKICNYTGYKGRTIIFEIIEITDEMQELIVKSPSTREIAQLARQQGALTLFDDGLEKAKTGITTIAEVMRVAEPPKLQNKT